ncbi:MAG: hypothetical protein NDI63_10960, partial [Pseudobdellovibrio sp.]|nr:hypothetical protein [Pseudobdellovibrio sp.]
MNEFIVSVDRNRSELRVTTTGRVHLPYGREGQLWNDIERPSKSAPDGQLSAEAQDLIDFATAIFHLDKICLRGEREQWVRKIHLKIGLRNPARFNLVADDLKWALSILGGDNFTFEVTAIRHVPRESIRTPKRVRDWGQLTDVALLSGGQDSYAGAARILEDQRSNPLLVRVNTRDKSNLQEIIGRFRQKFNRQPAFYSQTVASPKDVNQTNKERETTQRLRSFYFLAIGSVLGQAHNVNRLHINENGIMAIHLPLDAARSSTFSTRTAYPQFLNLFQGIVRRWLGHQIEIRNAFALNTKTEVLQECSRVGVQRGLGHTVSCAHSATIQQTVKRQSSKDHLMADEAPDLHCGYCFPCLLRRISMWRAGLANDDVEYATDPFKVLIDGSADNYEFVYEASSAVLGLIRLTIKFENPDFISMLSEYPQIAECATVLGEGSMNAIIDLHKRFAQDVRAYIAANASYLEFFFDQQRSRQLEQQVAAIASDQVLDAALQKAEVDASDAFYKQMSKLFDTLRLRV